MYTRTCSTTTYRGRRGGGDGCDVVGEVVGAFEGEVSEGVSEESRCAGFTRSIEMLSVWPFSSFELHCGAQRHELMLKGSVAMLELVEVGGGLSGRHKISCG